jgi:hypothetical protein
MLLSQIKKTVSKKYETENSLTDTYYEAKGYIQGLKDFGVINLGDYWQLKEYNQVLYKNRGKL